jgi:uncharacterized protein YjdB
VDESGGVRGVSSGETTVTVALENGKSDTIAIKVVQGVTGVTLNATEAVVRMGETYQLTASVQPENADVKDVLYTSSKPSVATVNESGLVTAVSGGETIVTVTTVDGEFKANCKITVHQIVKGVVLDVIYAKLTVGESFKLTASVNPASAQNKSVTYTTSDDGVVRVAADGTVTALKIGTAVVTVTTVDGEYTDECVIEIVEKTAEASGCQSSVSALSAGIAMLTAAGFVCLKKRKEN